MGIGRDSFIPIDFVHSHDLGFERFLSLQPEGLRFDKFLVASSCRSCLDPNCTR
jgi:hypothetical protein